MFDLSQFSAKLIFKRLSISTRWTPNKTTSNKCASIIFVLCNNCSNIIFVLCNDCSNIIFVFCYKCAIIIFVLCNNYSFHPVSILLKSAASRNVDIPSGKNLKIIFETQNTNIISLKNKLKYYWTFQLQIVMLYSRNMFAIFILLCVLCLLHYSHYLHQIIY